MSTLAIAGARQCLVPNLPDSSRTPAVSAQGPRAQIGVNALVQRYKNGLAALLATLDAWPTLDIYALISSVLDHPVDHGFTHVVAPCHCENAGQGCNNPDEYFCRDGLHPTTAAHRPIAEAVTATVAPIPVPAALPLLTSALAMTALWRRRRAASRADPRATGGLRPGAPPALPANRRAR